MLDLGRLLAGLVTDFGNLVFPKGRAEVVYLRWTV